MASNGTTFGGGAIAGIVVGILVLGALAALSVLGLLFYIRRRRSRRNAARLNATVDEENDAYQPLGGRHELGGMDKGELDRERAVEVHGEYVRELHGEAMLREAGGEAVHELDGGMEAAELDGGGRR